MYTIEEIQNFIADRIGSDILEVTPDRDIHNELGCTGDDFDELMQAYSKTFKVQMDTYLWYFHTDEEGQNFGGLFFKTPRDRVTHIPVTPRLLWNFANRGSWGIVYPEHKLPERRYDIIVNLVLVALLSTFLLYKCFR